jgi:accessory gene regulator protein AgrB
MTRFLTIFAALALALVLFAPADVQARQHVGVARSAH